MPISDQTRDEARILIDRYPVSRAALLPLLHLVQSDEGYVSDDGIAFCAEVLALTKAEVGAVATFYTMFKREPFGSYLLSVCTNPTCKIAGAQGIYESYVEACGGHVDRDGQGVMVEEAECLAICDAAPVVQVNYEMFGPLAHEEAMSLLDRSRAGEPPASPWSGEVPRSFREVERELSGIDDGVDVHLAAAARRQATESAVAPAQRSGETDIPVTHPGGDPAGHGGRAFQQRAGFGASLGEQSATASSGRPVESESAVDATRGQQEVVEELADTGDDVAADRARDAVGESLEPAPAAHDQPPTAGGGTSAEATDDAVADVAPRETPEPTDSETPADADAADPAETDSLVDTQNPTPSETPDATSDATSDADDEATDDDATHDDASDDTQTKES